MKQAFTSVFQNYKKVQKKGFWALKDVSFDVNQGDFFGIVGRNGSGKSTLLKMIAGVYLPTKGSINVDGKIVPFIELGVGFNPELTAHDNVYLNGALLGFMRSEMEKMYDEIVSFAELEEHMDVKLKNFSSGMQVRLAFSIAIRAKSDILLLDEVLAVGDAAFQKKCFDYFRLLKKEKRTVVFISHNMNAVREYCTKAVLLDDGLIISSGTPEKVAKQYIKMFQSENAEKQSSNEKRWGTGNVKVKDLKASITQNKISITVRYDVNTTSLNPVFGLSIFSPVGTKIFESNTIWKKMKTGEFSPGTVVTTDWEIPNIFTNGNNTITLAVANEDATEFYDWWDEAYNLIVDKDDITSAATMPEFKLKVSSTK